MSTTALIGRPVHRVEDMRFLRGTGTFVDDLKREGMLHAVVLRSSVAHGRLRRIDVLEARAKAGVRAIVTAQDIGQHVPNIPLPLSPAHLRRLVNGKHATGAA